MTKEQLKDKDKKLLERQLIRYIVEWGTPFTILTYTVQHGLKESVNKQELQNFKEMEKAMFGEEAEEEITDTAIILKRKSKK